MLTEMYREDLMQGGETMQTKLMQCPKCKKIVREILATERLCPKCDQWMTELVQGTLKL